MDKQKALNHINKYTDAYLDFLTDNDIYINQNDFNLRTAILNDISEDLQKIKNKIKDNIYQRDLDFLCMQVNKKIQMSVNRYIYNGLISRASFR